MDEKVAFKAFDNTAYVHAQSAEIKKRARHFHRLYFEIGGHLLYDGHASRVLPGYEPTNKLAILKDLRAHAGIVYCINSEELALNREWGTSGKKLADIAQSEIKALEKAGLSIIGIACTFFNNQKAAVELKEKFEAGGRVVLCFTRIKKYPTDEKTIFGPHGFDAQPLLETDKKIIAVTGAGANNGKLFFCLSQIYHLDRIGLDAGYAKLETFPVAGLPIDHDLNSAYEAATADIGDVVLFDPYHKQAYGKTVVNYNRDIEAFPVLKHIITKITGEKNFMRTYHSPTDMGINMVQMGIRDDALVRKAARKEILHRQEEYERKYKNSKTPEAKRVLKRIHDIVSTLEKQ